MTDIFIDSARTSCDLAGVIEIDDETAIFYLCATDGGGAPKIIDAINMGADLCNLPETSFNIGWNSDENIVIALVNGEARCAYEIATSKGAGLNYKKISPSEIGSDV